MRTTAFDNAGNARDTQHKNAYKQRGHSCMYRLRRNSCIVALNLDSLFPSYRP